MRKSDELTTAAIIGVLTTGGTTQLAAGLTGASESTVLAIAKRQGIRPRVDLRKNKLSYDDQAEALRLHEKGLSNSAIGRALGVSQSTISRFFTRKKVRKNAEQACKNLAEAESIIAEAMMK